jgi:hypothetical protein
MVPSSEATAGGVCGICTDIEHHIWHNQAASPQVVIVDEIFILIELPS